MNQSNSNTMAQPRPPFQPQRYPSVNGMSPTYTSPSPQPPTPGSLYPQHGLPYSPPQQYAQLPAQKRQRLSPGAQSPYMSPQYPMAMPQAGSPVNNMAVNGFGHGTPTNQAGLMGPPSRPAEKATNVSALHDPLVATGINVEEEERQMRDWGNYSTQTPSFQSPQNSFGTGSNTLSDRPGSSGSQGVSFGTVYSGQTGSSQITSNEVQRRREAQADWDSAKQHQNPMRRFFLMGATLNRRLTSVVYENGLKVKQIGIMVPPNSQPPPTVRVNGDHGATQVISRGESILRAGEGDNLGDILNVLALATRERVTGLADLSGRLALERQQHSKGRVPTEWASVAAVSAPSPAADGVSTPNSLKRTFSEANVESSGQPGGVSGPHPIVGVFLKSAKQDRMTEASRRAKRARRAAASNPDAQDASSMTPGGNADIVETQQPDSERKTTKKDRKAAETKFSETQHYRSANETARMATAGIFGGSMFGKKKKEYAWMSGGAASKGTSTPTRVNASASASVAATPGNERAVALPRDKQFGQWDEDKDAGIQSRDLLLVLETDDKAPRSLLRAYNAVEK